MSSSRETIHISLGSTANLVSAHLLNLQGLAATSDDCPAHVTHDVQQDFFVPRCLFVEEGDAFQFQDAPRDPTTTTAAVATVENPYLQAANLLAYAQYSRYRAPKSHANVYTTTSNGRHVEWSDDEDGAEEEEEEEVAQKRQKRERDLWQTVTVPSLQKILEDRWTDPLDPDPGNGPSAEDAPMSDTPLAEIKETKEPVDYASFFAPPFPNDYQCVLPFSSKSNMVETWDSYTTASLKLASGWNENVLFEKLRKVLEKSNGVQGVTIATEGHGVYAGLTTALLQELQDECRTAGRIVLHVTDPTSTSPASFQTQDSWQPAHVMSVRKDVESGLAMFDFGQTAHAIVPIQSASQGATLFERTSQIAMAWETATLAYRAESALMATGYGDTPSRLTVREFLTSLQPTERYKLLELDYYAQSYLDLQPVLQLGTSVERRVQQQNRESQSRPGPPGEWMETLLKKLSPSDNVDDIRSARSMHHHWSLTSSMRSSTRSLDDLTCIMEGMGIRYRPDSTLGVLVDQSFKDLISCGYAAGSYWKADSNQAVVAVLSNSTRSYGYAKKVANHMKDKLTLLKFKGYHNRDVTHGVLPEKEDCLEALEYCLGLRDTYHPPEGSGLGDDAEGTYFDD